MIPTIRKSFLIKLLVVVLTLTGGIFGLHHVQARRIPDALMAQADRAADAGRSDAAIHYLKQYLEFRPEDADAQERLAKLLKARSRSTTDLLFLYEKILRNHPNRHSVRRDALAASMALGRYSDAETHASELLKHFPDEASLWEQRGISLGALQKPTEARECFEAAIRCEPNVASHYQEYAQYLWRELKKRDDAKLVLDRLVAALPHDPEPYLTRGRFVSFLMGEIDAQRALSSIVPPGTAPEKVQEAASQVLVADLRKALDLDPENVDALLLLAEYLQKGRDLNAARDCMADGLRTQPSEVRLIRGLSWLELNRGNIGAAVNVLEEGMTRVKDPLELLVPLGDLLVQLGETDRTNEIIARMEANRTPVGQMQVKYLRGRVAMRRQKWDEAIDLLGALRADSHRLPGLENQTTLLLSMCYQKKGNTDKEQELLKILTNNDPNNLGGRVSLAQAFLNSGQFALAAAEYQKASASPYCNPSTTANGLRLRAVLLRSSSTASGADWEQIEHEARLLAGKFSPAVSDAAQLRADLARIRGAYDKSMAILRDEAMRRPTDARTWANLAVAVADYAGVSAGLAIVDEAQAATGDGPEMRLARAGLYARDPARLRPINPLANLIDTWPEAEQLRLLYGLIEIYDRLGDEAGVIRTYRRIAGRRPTDIAMWEALYERAVSSKDSKSCTEARSAIGKLERTAGPSAALLAAWDVIAARQSSDAPAALATMTTEHGAAPDRADACVAIARLKALAGDPTGARSLFDRAVRLEPTRFAPTLAWLVYLAETSDTEALQTLINRLSRDYRWTGEPLQRSVRHAMKQLDPSAAKRLLEASRKVAEYEPGGLGWLADCYKTAGLQTDRKQLLERAVTMPGANADDWLRLLLTVAESGMPANTAAVLRQARQKLPPAQFLATAASFADTPNAPAGWVPDGLQEDEHRGYIQARLGLKLSCYQRSEAVTLLEEFLVSNKLAEKDAAWARRHLAMLLAARGGATDRTRAKQLLAENAAVIGDTPEEKRSTAAVLAGLSKNLEGEDRKEVIARAIEIMIDVARQTSDRRDRFLLVQLYRLAGNRSAARSTLSDLIRLDQRNIDYLVIALDEATEPSDVKFAEDCARALLILYPNEFRAVQAVARFEVRQGHADRALVLADGYSRTADANPGDLHARIARAAELLDELARLPSVRHTPMARKMTDAAVEKYENLISTRPEAMVAAVGLLAADGRIVDAFAKLEKLGRGLPMRVRVMAGLGILRAGGATPAQTAMVREWINTTRDQEPDSLAVMLHDAEWHTLKQDFSAAERVYEAILKMDDRNVVSLNNLAWMLAARPDATVRAEDLVERAVREIGLTGDLLDTRARIRLSASQIDAAERDLLQALSMERTPLRLFHLALVRMSRTPPRKGEALDNFRKAKAEGLDVKSVHPADVVRYRAFEADLKK